MKGAEVVYQGSNQAAVGAQNAVTGLGQAMQGGLRQGLSQQAGVFKGAVLILLAVNN